MIEKLKEIIPKERVRSRYIDLISFASDAGFYQLIPKAVVQPVSESEIISLFQFSQEHKIPIVFRTGGTSLSGQSITDGILVDLSQHWSSIRIEDGGEAVRVQPGITGGMVNAHLKAYGRKIGPDPSSISAAMMGGIVSNNSSGMCCGVSLNSYHTTKFIRFILPDGKAYSTENPEDYDRFKAECAMPYDVLLEIRDQISTDKELYSKIRSKYLTKTTVGYSLNAFIDHDHPLDILAHLLIGGEGTLAFISEVVMKTVPDYPCKLTGLLYFPTIYEACRAITPLATSGALMVELMDRASLRAIENLPGMPADVKLLPDMAAALLVEFQGGTMETVVASVEQFRRSLTNLSLLNDLVFTSDAKEQDFLWKVRKGLFPAVGAVRASGTTVVLEDIAFPVSELGNAIVDLQQLFKKYDYSNAIIFGHAKDGNIHFVVTQSFDSPEEITRYDLFMREVVTLVVHQYGGTLKAEHGTGRNMAPFVETEWGGDAYQIMKRIKHTIDPDNLLNPGVIINDDPLAYIKNLKDLPSVEEEVDRCIECGYCEHRCPSRDITTTPRRRIVIRRALKKLQTTGDQRNYRRLLQEYQYDGLETCAVDGLCAPACPVDINTGDLVKRLRRENHSRFSNVVALVVAKNFSVVERVTRMAIWSGTGINRVFGANTMTSITSFFRRIIPAIPLWLPEITPPPSLKELQKGTARYPKGETIVYFPACISRMMGTYAGKEKSIVGSFLSVCEKARMHVVTLNRLHGGCCGQVFSSKGYGAAQSHIANVLVKELWDVSHEGKYPVVTDVSSCAQTLHQVRPVLDPDNQMKFDRLPIIDSVEFLHDYILTKIHNHKKKESVVLHPVCSLQKMKAEEKFINVARKFAERVVVPKHAGCCGMAGDRGFRFPELTASATKKEAVEVSMSQYDGYYSSTKTCELAMTKAVGKKYESILYLADEMME